jgi:hypothetical protein
MENLMKYNVNTCLIRDAQPYTIKNLNLKSSELMFKNSYVLIINKSENYDKFEILSDMFMEDLRIKCTLISSSNTPYAYFHKNYDIIARNLLYNNISITPHNIREYLWARIPECTSFKPNVMMAIKQILFNDNDNISILDPSSGWGDRLIAAIALNVNYTGVDPNSKVHPRYTNIIDHFKKKIKKNIEMICKPFENLHLNKQFDFIFTSPPYFNLEIYSSEESQSVNSRINTESKWFDLFFKPYLINAFFHLKSNGYLAININQKNKSETYVSQMIKLIQSLNIALYLGVISYINEYNKFKPQPIFIWKKL